MTNKIFLTHDNIESLSQKLNLKINSLNLKTKIVFVYPIPRGGVPATYMCKIHSINYIIKIVNDPHDADIFIDDIIDSGATKDKYAKKYPGIPFYALIDKTNTTSDIANSWIVFPWEVNDKEKDEGITDNVRRILQYVGEDPLREGVLETPARVQKAWQHWTSGYDIDIAKLLKVFEDGGENYDEMVMVKNIPIYSKCEHHLADIFGTATIAYIPNGRIVGLSKLSRVADAFSRRLQVQERLTTQIADALEQHLKPKAVGVIIRARHMCMESRGICQQGHHTITSALRGVFKTDSSARAEFMMLAKE